MKVFTATGIEGSTAIFRRFLRALDSYEADVGVLLGDLTGRRVISAIKTGASTWEVPIDDKVHQIDSPSALEEITSRIESHGDYWVEQTRDEFEHMRGEPMVVDLLFKSLVRERMEQWLDLAEERLNGNDRPVFVAPGCGDWTIIDDLLEQSSRMTACDNRIVRIDGYEMVTSSASGPTDWELAREIDDRSLHANLLELCSGIGDPDFAIFNLQADSRAAQRIIKRFQPLLRVLGSVQGGTGGARHRGRTLELCPRADLIDDAARALHGVLVILEDSAVKDYVFADV